MECIKGLKELEEYKIKDLKQRARIKWDLEGNENSAFFQGYINSRRAANNILGLMIDELWTTKPSLVKKEIKGFFKLAFEEKFSEKISDRQNWLSVFECGADKAPGPDRLNSNF